MLTCGETQPVLHSKMPIALVTGIDGFTGRHLIPELEQAGFTVCGFGNTATLPSSVQVVECDLTDRKLTLDATQHFQPDVVVHLAGIAFAPHDDVEAIYRTHVLGTRNLLEGFALCVNAPKAVLLASSANIYGNADVTPITETTPPAPANDYSVSKLAMEYLAKLWQEKLPITIARPFNYTGRGQSLQFLLPKIVEHFKRRAPEIELGNLEVVRDFSDVRDVVRAYRKLIELSSKGEVFNVCSGVGHSLNDVIELMREISGHDLAVRINPAFIRLNEIHKLVGSRAKLDAKIGREHPILLRETLRWMFEAD